MKQMMLVGLGQESMLDEMGKYQNFLIFKQENGSTIRIHVPEDSIKELITEMQGEKTPPSEALRGPEDRPDGLMVAGATEFGGDETQDERPVEPLETEPDEEELESEDDVASL